jgi:hypothetical protein
MPELCNYLNCHNLASSNYQGYCNEEHMKRGPETEFLLMIIYSHKEISTLKEARIHKLTSSFHCEVCKELLRE